MCLSLSLQTAAADVPLVALNLKVDHLHLAFQDAQITSVAALVLCLTKVLEKENLPLFTLFYCWCCGGIGAGAATNGWFLISSRAPLKAVPESHVLGTCWAPVSWASLFTRYGQVVRAAARRGGSELSEWHLRGGNGVADVFELYSEVRRSV